MPQQTSNIPQGVRKWTIICGGVALLVIAVVVGILLRGGGADPGEKTRLAAEQLNARVKGLMDSGEFDAAAGAIGSFLKDHPDPPDPGRLWALKTVFHRKGGDSTEALLSLAAMAEKLQGRGGDLCDAGDVLVAHECYQDAAKAFELASGDASVRGRACYQAAMCNYRLGRFAMAMKYIDAASALSPNDPKITAAVKRIEDARFVPDE
ncbi:MAG: tetratricopeptide repeat protein [Phycisphaerae bacterium]|jgi:tetratricopeptide (TPR) repeat protein|nr:tetratricopeptide repeat protein [Phycisphaerae bacterium]